MPLALYVHMPWCVRKCPYCDFNSHQLKSAAPDASYIDALIRDFELELPRLENRTVDTVFFGGGTPSLFQPEDFRRLLLALRQRIAFADNAEVTMEANPGTIERGRFAGYRDAGINRVSLGAQTFAPRALEVLGRIHSADDTHRAAAELRAAKLDNFNLDLMYALPDQTLEQALADVRIACALRPSHLSHYQLTLEPGTVFHARPPRLPDEDAAWQMQTESQKLLAEAGYAQYEVSAYAQEGARCRHNLNYWSFGDYVGIGAGAHGKLTLEPPRRIVRTTKPKQPREYQEQVRRAASGAGACVETGAGVPGAAVGESAYIAEADLPFEFMLNALRLNDGFTVSDYRRGTGLAVAAIEGKLAAAEGRGLLMARAGGWQPTELGRRFLNNLLLSFLA
jgi:oxygen-independent coproporphyrinogen-3 oxidase